MVDLAVALLIALSLDSARRQKARVFANRWPRAIAGSTLALSLAVVWVAALVPIVGDYHLYTVHDDLEPAWFTQVLPRLTRGQELLVMPYPSSGSNQAMAWQADDRFEFTLAGGEAQVPGADGRHSIHIDPLKGATQILNELSFGYGADPAISLADVQAVRQALIAWGIDIVVVTDQTRYPPYVEGFMTEVTGRLPTFQDGVWVWYGVGPGPPLEAAADSLRRCAAAGGTGALGVPRCVMASAAP